MQVGLKICVITAGIKKHKLAIKKKEKRHDKMIFLAKNKLNNIEVIIFKAFIESYINHAEFVLIYNVLKEYDMKKEIKNLKNLSVP